MDTAYFEKRLTERKKELTARLSRLESELDVARSIDDDDRAIEGEGDEVMEELGEAGLSELRAIEAALDRIESSRFGICTRCGQPISTERLMAVPQAALCMACHREINL
jgi:RNA polymerase-binding protein DksA